MIPECVILSDSLNHNSTIKGILHCKAERKIFRRNDVSHLEGLLQQYEPERPKLVAFESLYSMDGDIVPIKDICDLSYKYGAITFINEVHAVGLYGDHGGGVAERERLMERLTVIQEPHAKGFGVVGSYIAGIAVLCDFIRSYGSGFIFSTSMPSAVAAAALESVRYVRSHLELRTRHQERSVTLKKAFRMPVSR